MNDGVIDTQWQGARLRLGVVRHRSCGVHAHPILCSPRRRLDLALSQVPRPRVLSLVAYGSLRPSTVTYVTTSVTTFVLTRES